MYIFFPPPRSIYSQWGRLHFGLVAVYTLVVVCVSLPPFFDIVFFLHLIEKNKLFGLFFGNKKKTGQRCVCLAWGYTMMMIFRTPIHMYRMWRPVGGRWVEGETRLPWEEEEEV